MRGRVEEERAEYARRLRAQSTKAEGRLWSRLRDRRLAGAKFRRQHPIGSYVVDFCCPTRRPVIELDGGQHASRRTEDAVRTTYLESEGYRVLRFWNTDVLANLDGVLARISAALRHPHPSPLPGRERGRRSRG